MAGIFGGSNSQKVTRYLNYDLQTSSLGVCIPLLWGENRVGTNLIWLNDFKAIPQGGGKGGGKGGGGKGATSYKYSAAVIFALCEGPIQSINVVWVNGSHSNLGTLNLTPFLGSISQIPPAFITSNYPAEAEAYSQTAYLFSSKYDFGSSPTIPSNNFEVIGYLANTMSGSIDANPADIIPDYITSTQYGLDPNATYIDSVSLAFYKTYCQAQRLLMSPYLRSQEQATQTIQRWAQLTNTWIFWNGVQLKFVPLGDAAITAHGATYTPNLVVIYGLTVDDFIPSQAGGTLITVTRVDPADGYNRVEIDARDRLNDYQTTPVYWEDQTAVDAFGQLQSQTISADEICDQTIAVTMTTLIGKRSVYIRNTYEFTTGYNYILLEPGDIIELTEPNIGLNLFPVRITEITEDADGNLKFKAEEFPDSIGQPIVFSAQGNVASAPPDLYASPGDINPPLILEPPVAITGGTPTLWLGASGGADWGGAQVYVSADGTNYVLAGAITSPTVQGVLTGTLASHADPDTVNTLALDVSESLSVLSTAVTHADADAFRTVALVGTELISFGTVASTGAFTYNLTYLRRGIYNTTIASHAATTPFSRVDPSAIFSYVLPQAYVGVTLYFKFPSFNLFGNVQESIAAATAYTYTPTGVVFTIAPPTTPVLTVGRVVAPDGTVILAMNLAWTASAGPSLGAYEIQYSLNSGSTWTTDDTIGASALTYSLSPAQTSTNYQARIRAISQNGLAVSTWATSSVVNSGSLSAAVPATPTGLAATPGNGSVALVWNPNATSDSVRTYNVWRAPGLGAAFGSATQIATVTSLGYVDIPLAAGSQWTYFLTATNTVGTSSATAGVNATVLSLFNTWAPSMSLARVTTASEELFVVEMVYPTSLPVNLTGSTGGTEVAGTGATIFTLFKNGVSIGTATIPGATTGRGIATFSFASPVSFAAGDTFSMSGPATPDATLKNFFFTFLGSR